CLEDPFMSVSKSLGVILFSALLAGCALGSSDPTDDVANELIAFPADAFQDAPILQSYGMITTPIRTTATQWGVVGWNANAGDEIIATVTATSPGNGPRAYLVEKREDGRYVSIFTASWGRPEGGLDRSSAYVRTKLQRTQTYYLVFRENNHHDASFIAAVDLE